MQRQAIGKLQSHITGFAHNSSYMLMRHILCVRGPVKEAIRKPVSGWNKRQYFLTAFATNMEYILKWDALSV